LLLLDADFPAERLTTVLEVLAIDVAAPDAAQHDEPTQVDFDSLQGLHDHLDRSKWLRGRYVILPNVTDGGRGTLIRKQMQGRYREMPCVGGYVDGGVGKLGAGATSILAGEDKKWGNKRIAVIQTSDARSAAFNQLGRHSTWIKWAVPTAEALRQACLAQESRISHDEPLLPAVVITELRVSNSKFMGPIDLALNPQYNALIGGRGTGKSTCLEYLRWALCDQPPELEDDDDMPNHAARRRRLISQTLEPFASNVEVDFVVNGLPHTIRRYAESGRVQLRVGDGTLEDAATADVRALLPIEAYSQRQLSSVGVRVDELTRFVTAPVRDRLRETASTADEIAADLRRNHAQLQRQRALTTAIAQDTVAVASLTQQAKNLREKLGGLSDADRECLADKPRYDQAEHLVEDWLKGLEQAREEAESFRGRLTRIRAELDEVETDLPEAELLQGIGEAVTTALEKAQDSADAAAVAISEAEKRGTKLSKLKSSWSKALKKFQKRYGSATERSSAHASKLTELEELEDRQKTLRDTVAENRRELAALENPEAVHVELRTSWQEVQDLRSQVMEEQCERLTELSDGLIRASVRRSAGTNRLQEAFKAGVTGSGVRTNKIEAFLDKVAASADPLVAWHEAMDELEDRVLRTAESSDPPALQSTLATFSDAELAKIVKRISPEQVVELSLLPLNDQPIFEYRSKEDEYIQFADASAGQQATALLRVLLNQSGPPLIIDQPEDDLDSQVILEVVDQLWAAKHRRQLIFSSHNANLVVNGDAELVICCRYRKAGDHSGGTIKLEGAIDIPAVRSEITVVMEGGEKAFRLRKEKYGF